MKKEVNTLFALLKSAVLGKELDELSKQDASEKADLLYEMARHHDLAHLVDYAYKTNGISIPDETVAFKFLKQQAMSVMRYETLNVELERICDLLENEKIPFVPLKGAVIRNLYPQGWMRTSCDIDILVHEENLGRVEKALCEKLGYTSRGERAYHDISLYSDTGVHLELHFNIKENMNNIDRLLEKVWDYASPKKDGGYEYVLTNEFLMFQHIAHMSFHVVFGGCGIKAYMDLVLLRQKVSFDEKVLFKMLEGWGIKTFYDVSVRLSKAWFEDGEHDETTLLLQKYLLGGGTYGTVKNYIAVASSRGGKFSYLLKRVFMPYDLLCTKYPNLKDKPYLLPYYQVRRWLRIVISGRIKDTSKEFSAGSDITDENARDVKKLFDSIGLKNKWF